MFFGTRDVLRVLMGLPEYADFNPKSPFCHKTTAKL